MFFLKDLPSRQMLEYFKMRFPQLNVDDVDAGLKLLRRASILLRLLEAYFDTHKLSQTRFLILVVLERKGERGGLLAKDIANKLDISRPIVTNTLKSMKENSFLKICPHLKDGRAKWITLTDAGREKLYNVLPEYYSIIHNFMSQEVD